MTSQGQAGTKPFVFGAKRSTSTSSSPERHQTFFDCLEEQDQKLDPASAKSTSPVPASVTVENRNGEAEERPPSSEPARTFDNPFATTVNRFGRIGNVSEPFNLVGPATESGNAPSSLFGKPPSSDSGVAAKASEGYERTGGLFGLFGAPRPSTPVLSKDPSSHSGNAASSLFGHPPPAQTSDDLSSASVRLNKQEHHQGVGFGQPDTSGPPAQPGKNAPSIFDLPPPQSGNPSSSLFENPHPSNHGKTRPDPFEGKSFFGGARPFDFGQGPHPLSGHPPPAQTSSGLFSASADMNGHERQGEGFRQPSTHGPSAQFGDVSCSIFGRLAPPQSGNTSSFMFGYPPPNYASGGGLFGSNNPLPGAPGGGLFGGCNPSPAPTGGLFGGCPPPPPAPTGGLFGGCPPPPAPSGGLFGGHNPSPASGGGLFGCHNPSSGKISLSSSEGFCLTSLIAPTGGLFGGCPPPPPPAPTGGLFGNYNNHNARASSNQHSNIFSVDTRSTSQDQLNGPGNNNPSINVETSRESAVEKIAANPAGTPPKLSDRDLQIKTDNAWTQQQSKIHLACSYIQDAHGYGRQAYDSFRQERDHWQTQIKRLEKTLEEKQAQVVSLNERIEQANEQANEQILQMRRYFTRSGDLASGTLDPDEWFYDCATNRKFCLMYARLRQVFSGDLQARELLEGINPEDVWYDLDSTCMKREVFLKDGYFYLRRSEGPIAAPDAAEILAAPKVEKKQAQFTDTFKPNTQSKVSFFDKDKSDTSNAAAEPATSGTHAPKSKPTRDMTGKIIKGRHGRIMSLGPSGLQTEHSPSQGKLCDALRTESTKALAGLTPTDENNTPTKPKPIRFRSDSTPLPVRSKRSSSARPINKDESESAKQSSNPAIRPLIKDEWLTNEQRVSRIRKEEDETVERAMLRKRQQKGQ